ncbi:ATP-binding protein [Rhodoblastus sphagnicola]|uniref:ATP-binding protein n=1 Tax=Rhodoblastus sphagnicola TaxID=333368 RepID=A0A2S6NBP3_9HYPH|nr:AAA family ATPase [Rhodoblastus sphagnicola]MBB4199698.1 exodeoxyribonuclease-5 [Rhodoblastus sphagnicola]PPQ32035.1 ATP-binding protein [Rhodoblastus sphagnicola]
MAWSAQQEKALKAVAEWVEDSGSPQVFRLFGYAGTGKTTLARHLAEQVDGDVQFGAFTGKAALVLRSKGCDDARTIHSMIYRPKDMDTEEPSFVLNEDAPASKASLIVIDECSMVDEDLGRDLLSFGKKVLVLGDPAQLPPIKGGGFFTEQTPDMMLTEVHRQAADNPIVRLSMQVRAGERLDFGDYGALKVVSRKAIDAELVKKADQVLVGLNKTRRAYNKRLRELFGFKTATPEVGEKLVCLRNDKTKGLLNGAVFRVHKSSGLRRARLRMSLIPEETPSAKPIRVGVLPSFFEGTEETLPYAQRRESDEFDYGYALTVHKAQGSQWDDVVLFDESYAFRENRERWLYTGVTRAAKSLTVVI